MEVYPALDAANIPEVADLERKQALYYVACLLENLVTIYEEVKSSPEGEALTSRRRPSYEQANLAASLVADRLGLQACAADIAAIAIDDALDDDDGSEGPSATVLTDVDKSPLYDRFWLKNAPQISIRDYLVRFDKYCRSSVSTYLTAGRYIYMVSVELRRMPVTRLNVFRLFCAAFVVAAKIVEDILYPFKRYATTGGVSNPELSKLETSFMFLVDFDLKIDAGLLKDSLLAWSQT